MTIFKNVLSKLSDQQRRGFLKRMVFKGGDLVNIDIGPIEKLPGKDVLALMRMAGTTTVGFACTAFTAGECFASANSACDASACKGNKGALITLDQLLQDVPPKTRAAYLDSLDFAKGQLVSAKSELLTGHVPSDRMKELPRVAKQK